MSNATSKHTPGPWCVDDDDDECPCVVRGDDVVADCYASNLSPDEYDSMNVALANAQLIAVAPDLYAHGQSLCEAIQAYLFHANAGSGESFDKLADARAALLTAIAKAEGKT